MWNRAESKQLRGKSLPEYCVLEPKCNAVLLSSDQKFEFTVDTEHPIVFDVPSTDSKANGDENGGVNFSWTQTDEDIIIHFTIPRDCSKNDIKIVCNGTKVHALHKNDSLLDAELYEKIDNDLTTWNLVNTIFGILNFYLT